jgi:hypothetical protein
MVFLCICFLCAYGSLRCALFVYTPPLVSAFLCICRLMYRGLLLHVVFLVSRFVVLRIFLCSFLRLDSNFFSYLMFLCSRFPLCLVRWCI